jgi:hypothetical protein
VIFEGVNPFETPAAMDELHGRYAETLKSGAHAPLLLAGAYVFDFLMIQRGVLNAAYAEFEARAGDLMSGRGSKALRIKQYVRSNTSEVFTFDEVQQALPDISADHIRSEMRKLRDAGVVESPGRGRKQWRRLTDEF